MDIQPVFKHELSYVEKALNEQRNDWTTAPVKKMATFKELSRVDVTQHKLAMFISKTIRRFPRVPVMVDGVQKKNEKGEDVSSMDIDDESMYDVTVRFVKECAIVGGDFDEQAKAEFLNDAGGIYAFGWWLMTEKILPFFLSLHTT